MRKNIIFTSIKELGKVIPAKRTNIDFIISGLMWSDWFKYKLLVTFVYRTDWTPYYHCKIDKNWRFVDSFQTNTKKELILEISKFIAEYNLKKIKKEIKKEINKEIDFDLNLEEEEEENCPCCNKKLKEGQDVCFDHCEICNTCWNVSFSHYDKVATCCNCWEKYSY